MVTHGYYGGYSLVRSSAIVGSGANSGCSCSCSCSGTNAASAKDGARVAGLSRMNFASCNSDWMPSLATSSAAGARSTVTPGEAMEPLASSTGTLARLPFLQTLWAMHNFYRFMPLCVTAGTASTLTPAAAASTTTAAATAATLPTPVSPAAEMEKVSGAALAGDSKHVDAKKTRPVIPMPIGSDTWTALSDTVLAAKTGVVATRHSLKRPVPPLAIGVTDADLDKKSTNSGPEPLFRDLLGASSPSEAPTYTAFTYNRNSNEKREPIPVDVLFSAQQQGQEDRQKKRHHHPVPPVPISVSPLLLPNAENTSGPGEGLPLFQKQTEEAEVVSDEENYVLRSPFQGMKLCSSRRSPTPKQTQQEKSTIPLLSNGINGAARHGTQHQNRLLTEGDEDTPQFEEDDEDALEHIKQLVNIVLSVNASENASTDAKEVPKPMKKLEFDMEWMNASFHNQQQTPFFQGL
ncbi:hypothetical protein TraAM80_03981 [Trypanosoma rangeli]|uniref:Uncharacterized protein n=1 Tax=Trypanosoma rangeli TaxID=5698 RepID=A0A3S5IRE8_TRYRA|nr:uncharacterized protein TraAM80_03981 [Trypanosoma rangeli]RNF06291.1 hypothetical protein TraAM80_03981 [Trypanosoma rangeli]|eukprot:RNF06291.1 hypothetical protein TraAM80_03981 [Trypanosoma rangeli]